MYNGIQKIDEVIEYIESNITGHLDYNIMAQKMNLSVYEFRFDIVGKKCQLGITGRIMESHEGKKFEKNYMVEIPVETVERTAFINGMNKCALEFTKQLVNDIQKF